VYGTFKARLRLLFAGLTLVGAVQVAVSAHAIGPERIDPPLLSLTSPSDAVLHGCKKGDLEKELRARLRSSPRFRLATAETPAPLSVEIVECSLFELRRRVLTTGGRPVRMPTGGGEAYGSESETGLRMEGNPRAVVRARLGAGSRFVAIASGPKDKNVREAADSVKRAIEAALVERGRWLLEEVK